jgi:glucosamine--fructose-6-phosphate aminotransferase (isomerizing)
MSASYLDEICEQPAMLRRLSEGLEPAAMQDLHDVRERLLSGDLDRVLLTGMGGSLYSAYPACLQLAMGAGVPVSVIDASELVQQVPDVITSRSLLIAISQSGESGELVELAKLTGVRPAVSVSVTNLPGNSLAAWADVQLFSMAGPERTVSSKTYTGGLACLHLLSAALCGKPDVAEREIATAADCCARMLEQWQPDITRIASFLDPQLPLVYVGRGRSLASAQTAALLTQEAAKLPCTALSGGQFRHGPIELVRPSFQAVVFLGDLKTRDIDLALIERIASLGGKVVVVAPRSSSPAEIANTCVFTYPDMPQPVTPIAEAIFIQLLQIPLAEARGFVAGQFTTATKVTGIL